MLQRKLVFFAKAVARVQIGKPNGTRAKLCVKKINFPRNFSFFVKFPIFTWSFDALDILNYQDAFVTPGICPLYANSRKQTRQSLNLR